ncbi:MULTISPECIES: HAMP domain-containing sensor histidine kinase [unclassified Mesorhizobium]|uniref:sensor histidine kinase n=1 Tax=unclassified Mesorhizobium TaxID=325217 RepID=UPI000BAF2DD0|nr:MULTISPECIES: HAMP domain-containing sensor histidine kinase [unclassified Mesorhizobium]TGT59898.1 HAMP domain-containing histidine kinase [Mesorhizobium sp. M00.F.Ca.ET.170.01.1.1]AZO08054.1 HAMP domain-containing histidine kinase [Mesorhizobium sp. M3A.F.Ca.ET.080.04.2.1]PBB86998.1 two-component sensor histidine kinase [Mesorhizobium sp. WSM3876]RWB70331.1 MAG: HAMP domain-containing histidine kinase [Mesorhizobium sp.]RWB91396.1 MAG: HAMP domain-containing histidine kinase [Mesorhizobiu
MPLLRSDTADKFIVDRRRPHRNSDVARAVRRTRDRLSQQAGSPDFDRELLKLHARAMVVSAAAIPLLVLAIATVGLFAGLGRQIPVWALLTLVCYTAVAFLARRVERTEASAIAPSRTRREFLIGHFLCGLCWAWFAWLGCGACQVDQFQVIKAMLLLVAMAITAVMASSLGGVMVATFAIPVGVYAYAVAGLWLPIGSVMAALLIVALPFFAYVARQLNQSSWMLLSFRSEKDALVAEVETAKSMSDEARRRAEDANLAKSRFLASMSHELRTPLNAILGFSEVMANEVLGPMNNPTYREYARDVHESGQHLLDLINEILDLSRIEAGRYQLNEEPVMLVTVVEDCCHMMELRARNKDIRVVQEFETTLPRLLADERAVRQITLNLLSNAIKFTPSGGEVRVRVGWTAGGGQYVSVKDNGPGIPQEEIPVVLSAFGQGSIAIKSAEQGTGLGLPIVQGLLAMHGGEFELNSKLREGTEAIATFPLSRVMEELPALPTKAVAARRR